MVQHITNKFLQFAFCFILLCLTGCTMKLAGIYTPVQNDSTGSSTLHLNSDSTFSYMIFSELQKDTFSGNWYVMKDTLLLKITSPFNDDSLLKAERAISKTNSSVPSGKNKLKVLVQDSIPFTVATVFINNDQIPINLDANGEAIVNDEIYKVKVEYQNIEPRTFTISQNANNDFTIFIYDKAFIPLNYLSPVRKWIIRGKNLLPLHKNNRPFKNYAYKKK